MVAKQLLWGPYLQNRSADFANFLHAGWYGGAGFAMRNSAPSEHYLGRERISWFPWQPFGILKFRFREVFFVPAPDLAAKFGAHRSINGRVVSAQTNIVTLLKL